MSSYIRRRTAADFKAVTNGRDTERIEVILRSPSLYRGEFRAIQDRSERPRKRWGGQQIKDRLQPLLYGFIRHAPGPIALLPFHAIIAAARVFYWYKGNPLRRACEDVAIIARGAGYRHEPKALYRRYLANVLAAARAYRTLIRTGSQNVLGCIAVSEVQRALREPPLAGGGAFILFAPHNLSAVYSAVALARLMPLLIIARNSKTIRRTRLAVEVFERIQARVLMVRGGNPIEISRAMFAALDDRQVLAATVDNIDPGFGVEVRIFGVKVEFAPWAARIAAKRQVPVVPVYFHSTTDGVRIALGEPLVTGDPVAAIQHYASYFEQKILEDPASWAYLVDRKWCRVLRQASQVMRRSGSEPVT